MLANFTAFINHLKIPTLPLRVTFGLSRDHGDFEWSSTSISTMFAQPRNIISLTMWRMLFDIWRFNLFAVDVLDPNYKAKDESVGNFLERNMYSETFQNDYLVPLVSSLWVHDPDETLHSVPIVMLVRYLWNHHILSSFGHPLEWMLLDGGCKQYVDAILAGVPSNRLHRSTPVLQIKSEGDKHVLHLENGTTAVFDQVIMATHAPEALRILCEDATMQERKTLGKFRTSSSSVVLHSDISVRTPFKKP